MGESEHLLTARFNRSLQVEARDERLSGDGGAVLLREAMERSGIVADLADWLEDPRDPDLITYTLAVVVFVAIGSILPNRGASGKIGAVQCRQ